MSARFETKGANHWQGRSGYRYSQRVPAPIMPIERPSVLSWLKGLGK